jgi:hypothetical protein
LGPPPALDPAPPPSPSPSPASASASAPALGVFLHVRVLAVVPRLVLFLDVLLAMPLLLVVAATPLVLLSALTECETQ